MSPTLLRPQGHEWINLRRPAWPDVTGGGGGNSHERGRGGERGAVEPFSEERRRCGRSRSALSNAASDRTPSTDSKERASFAAHGAERINP